MQVREIMTADPACCTPDTDLQEVARMMVEHDCGCIPVVDSQWSMNPVGTITDRDITVRTLATGQNPMNMKASDAMTVGIATIKPDASVQECCDVMEDKKIRRVLVVDETGRCCGIVAQADVAEYGPNPTLVSRVVHEISESAPTPNAAVSRSMKNDRSGWTKKSLFTTGSLLPLMAGVGTGMALNYFFDFGQSRQKYESAKHSATRHQVNKSRKEDNAPIGTESRVETYQAESQDAISGYVTPSSSSEDERRDTDEIGRSARQGS
jgi:CBS domain-containing protein